MSKKQESKKVIGFWHKEHFMSQWHPVKFTENNITFSNCEQYMMYHKALLFKDNEVAEKILKTTDPAKMKKYGREVKNFDEDIWKENRSRIVTQCNYLKFSQNKDLAAKLLETGDAVLAEASPYDKIWGIGMTSDNKDMQDSSKWKGLNLLGYALMDVRKQLAKIY
jgi:ribA/ribD-fused uncharacterized protein